MRRNRIKFTVTVLSLEGLCLLERLGRQINLHLSSAEVAISEMNIFLKYASAIFIAVNIILSYYLCDMIQWSWVVFQSYPYSAQFFPIFLIALPIILVICFVKKRFLVVILICVISWLSIVIPTP
jgi:hypothetical protein